ncbi:MAG: FecR domain-containing protein [Cyclobacteriaceae bacterium]|nr:FecR domain-containing protein [Cyclobacteriaceae bacterium SS2]
MQENSGNVLDLVKNEYFVHWIVAPTEESTHFWTQWISNHPDRKRDVDVARQLIRSTHYSLDEKMPEKDYYMVLENIVDRSQQRKKKSGVHYLVTWKAVGIAASLLLAMFLGVWVSQSVSPAEEQVVVAEPQLMIKQNPRGQKSTIMLPDGTKVILNSESSISYLSNFTGNERLVELTGEAFFDVVRDPAKPFVVKTKSLMTTALGTSFNVDAYPDGKEEITLVTGKVRVNSHIESDQSTLLEPGEIAALEFGALNKKLGSSLNHIKWKDGFIVFQKTPFQEGIMELERWYGVTIDVKNLSANEEPTFTAHIENDNLANVLETLGYAMRFDFRIEGKKVLINFK